MSDKENDKSSKPLEESGSKKDRVSPPRKKDRGKSAKAKGPKPLKVKKQKPKDWTTPELAVTSSPHVFTRDTTNKIMWTVFIVLLPAYIWGILHFAYAMEIGFAGGFFISYDASLTDSSVIYTFITNKSFQHLLVAVFSCMLTEFLVLFFRKQKLSITLDGSAAVTGILLAMTLPPHSPLFVSMISAAFVIFVIKHLFGGLGSNFLNPAVAGRVFAMVSWPGIMYSQDSYLLGGANSEASATSLELMKKHLASGGEQSAEIISNPYTSYSFFDLFFGNTGGSIGEVSVLLLLLAGIYIFIKKYITWEIPVSYIGVVFLLSFLIGGKDGEGFEFALYHVLSGGLFLGAFFMATDMVTSPLTSRGQLIFGVCCGLLTVMIRLYGGYPEGVVFSILIMNLFTPLIDRYTMPRVFGHKKRKNI